MRTTGGGWIVCWGSHPAFLNWLGHWEVVVVLAVLVLLLFAPRIPAAMWSLGRGLSQFGKGQKDNGNGTGSREGGRGEGPREGGRRS